MPAAFPGALIACSCGFQGTVAAPSPPPSTGPYRSVAKAAPPAATMHCPYCGNECPSLVRVCPHCDVRLDSVRCVRCYSLQAPGEFSCARCGQRLELEPLFDATDAPCPRCTRPLEIATGQGERVSSPDEERPDPRVHECASCGGLFVSADMLAEILARAQVGGAWPTTEAARGIARLDEVRYLACPLCRRTMNRVNFGKLSGVIVDVCRHHGTWFDAGELTRVVAFAASGGLEKTRAREVEEKAAVRAALSASAKATFGGPVLSSFELRRQSHDEVERWREFLRVLFRS
ncbi:zf-TFIIB domain-containing protein [Labilithrix luteola]|uniref:TFIIB-type zinc ribbon-containing protein n=1 Tax=Labilithrix luteola TaxID=1391654 RepID=UPI001969AD8C|nr:zf-TFIIB domain-containing protein [Labilithrix luteola]